MLFDHFSDAQDTLQNKGFLPLLDKILVKFKSKAFDSNASIWFVKDLNEVNCKLNGFSNYEKIFDDLNMITEWIKKNNTKYSWMYCEKEISVAREYGHIIPFLKP